MRRIIVLMIALLLPCAALAQALPLGQDDLAFIGGETVYPLGCAAAPLVGWLTDRAGEMSVTSAPSCLFLGEDREYQNEGFIVGTLPTQPDGGDTVESVTVLVSGYPTSRGIEVGMSRQEVIAAYGDDFRLDYDQMDYLLDKDKPLCAQLSFFLDLETDLVISYMLLRNTTQEQR